jgi:hypothetical protein
VEHHVGARHRRADAGTVGDVTTHQLDLLVEHPAGTRRVARHGTNGMASLDELVDDRVADQTRCPGHHRSHAAHLPRLVTRLKATRTATSAFEPCSEGAANRLP